MQKNHNRIKQIIQSRKELSNVRSLSGAGILVTLNAIISVFRIQVSNILEISFASIMTGVCGFLYGPILTGIAGVVGDLVKFMIRPTGAFFPGFTLNEFLIGVLYGCFFYKKEITWKRVLLARISVVICINLILTPIWLNIMYGTSLFALPRIIKNIVLLPIDTILLYTVLKIAKRVHRK
ncbi:MAG: folate family ECF transporter S component [Erysipelotrichaceae bacterium]|nr:folate family ECF transporter S component [Erysipelotrichaceae bacterium]